MGFRGMSMIVASLFILVVPGVAYNNLNNSGLIPGATGGPVAAQTLTCPGWPDITCQGSVNVGCQASSTYCTLSGTTFSFLNANSPFTQLIQGNPFALFNEVTTGNAAVGHGPYDSVGGGSYFIANCVVYATSNKTVGLTNWLFRTCQEANTDGSNMTKANSNSWNNYNTNQLGLTKALPFYGFNTFNSTGYTFNCNWNLQVNYTFSGTPYSGYTWYGCDAWSLPAIAPCSSTFPPSLACIQKQYYNAFLISVPLNQGVLNPHSSQGGKGCIAGSDVCWHVQVPVQLEQWDSSECHAEQSALTRNIFYFLVSPQCDQWETNINNQVKTTGNNMGFLTPIITFIVGLAFFFLGLGIQISGGASILSTGTSIGVGSNRQGTKLMQVLGIGLVVWSVMYSQFSTWFTTGLLPYGLDGSAGIVSILLTGIFFFGVYDQTTTG